MKTRVFHWDIKCSPYKGILGQPIKVGLKTSNPHEDAGCSGRNFHIFREDLDKTDQNKLIITILQKIMLSKRMMEKLRTEAVTNYQILLEVWEETITDDVSSTEIAAEVTQ